ncbi:MAG: hypothetical protein HYV93_20125 [Candidatus Rokubacteria bacterium]|nr:hypothetical protein [Candidatus Rokubacteria bacterium]
MDSLDRLLRDDLNRLLDRIVASSIEGGRITAAGPDDGLRNLMDSAEAHLAEMRFRLLQDYERWRQAMDECESLWALSRLRTGDTTVSEEPAEVPRAA